jgi:uncharacterized protein
MTALSHPSELDTGRHTRAIERFCVATRTARPVADMIRFVVGPDGEVVPDIKSKLPGRGLWVTACRDALDDAVKRRVFSRGFKREVRVPPDLPERTEGLLMRSALEALAMAGKAGLVLAGFAKAEAALQRDDAVALLHASEAAPDGVRKLDTAMRRRPDAPDAVIRTLSSAQLDLALGRSNVIHAALLAGSESDTFLARMTRLDRFRTGRPSGGIARNEMHELPGN